MEVIGGCDEFGLDRALRLGGLRWWMQLPLLEAVVLAEGVRVEALGLLLSGESIGEAGRRLGISNTTVWRWARLAGMTVQRGRIGGLAGPSERRRAGSASGCPAPAPEGDFLDGRGHLTFAGRVLIGIRLREKCSQRVIAAELGTTAATVSRELARGCGGDGYQARVAHRRMLERGRRPKVGKLDPGTVLRGEVVSRLNLKHSPQQIAARLRIDFPTRQAMWVSHETIYQALYVQGAGGLRHELSVEKALRHGRTSRRPVSKLPRRSNRPWIGDAVIGARPADVADRAVPGHWEGDLVIGAGGRSALITLNERHTRYTLISRVTVHDTLTVTERLIQMVTALPQGLLKSLTWDQGVEMAGHARFAIATGAQVYFCDPHSPWQRPTNENGNGLIRDFYPKGSDFTQVTDHAIAQMEHLLNTRPRRILDYATPAERLNQLITVASTT